MPPPSETMAGNHKPTVQDRPPTGGFPAIEYARKVPVRGPSGLALFVGGAVVSIMGFVAVARTNQRTRRLKAEEAYARIALTPFLEAESDRREIRMQAQMALAESKIMRDVKDWKVAEPVYNTKRYVKPDPEIRLGQSI